MIYNPNYSDAIISSLSSITFFIWSGLVKKEETTIFDWKNKWFRVDINDPIFLTNNHLSESLLIIEIVIIFNHSWFLVI